MDETQIGGKAEIPLRFQLVAKRLMGFPQIQIQGWIKISDPVIVDRFRMFQGDLIPAQGFFGTLLKAGDIMRGDAGFVIIGASLPCLLIQRAGFFGVMFEFSATSLNAELDDGVVSVQNFLCHCEGDSPTLAPYASAVSNLLST
ncbi:hypothetical protein ANAEL_00614 [Anaerolineales bacterium]|nr:hypothetical protein ANAEL_00614 [Anaerolineales bacterium]